MAASFMPGEHVSDTNEPLPSLTVKLSFEGDTSEDMSLLESIHSMLRDPNSAKSALADDEEELKRASNEALARLGKLGPFLREVWTAAEGIAQYMPHMELGGASAMSPARILSPTRGGGGGGGGVMGLSGGGPNRLAETEKARHAKLGELVSGVNRCVQEVSLKSEELPDVVGAYFKDCFAVLDPGLAMVEVNPSLTLASKDKHRCTLDPGH